MILANEALFTKVRPSWIKYEGNSPVRFLEFEKERLQFQRSKCAVDPTFFNLQIAGIQKVLDRKDPLLAQRFMSFKVKVNKEAGDNVHLWLNNTEIVQLMKAEGLWDAA